MSVNEDKNESNSQEDHEDNSDEENSSDENSSRPRLMDQDRREYNLSKLFNEEQSERYDKYKVSSIEHDKKNRSLQKLECPRIKKICQNLLGDGIQIGNLVQIIINGVTKIYAGELVEEAKKIMVEETEAKIDRDDNNIDNKDFIGKKRFNSPIRPRHLREARRRMIERGVLPLILNNNTKIKKSKII